MKKSVLKNWILAKVFQWAQPVWWFYVAIFLICMLFPVFGYPGQLLITTVGKALLAPIPSLSEWAVRHFTINGDDMFFVACQDCGRLFFLSCIFLTIIEFFGALVYTYITVDEEKSSKKLSESIAEIFVDVEEMMQN